MDHGDDIILDSPEVVALLQCAREGDETALGQLLDRFRSLLKQRACESLAGPIQRRVDESDVVQQTCLSAIRRFDQFRGEKIGQFIAWLLQIHEHNILNTIRRHRGADKRNVDREVAGSGPLAGLAGRLTSPSQKAIRSERKRALEQALERLPQTQAEAVRLRYFKHASLAEIAERLGKSEDACAGLLKRGMAQLRQQLQQDDLS